MEKGGKIEIFNIDELKEYILIHNNTKLNGGYINAILNAKTTEEVYNLMDELEIIKTNKTKH